jgi:hypothetical protein
MSTQSRDKSQNTPMNSLLGMVLLLIGLLIAIFYAVQCRHDIASLQLSDFTFVVLGISLQLMGLGVLICKK